MQEAYGPGNEDVLWAGTAFYGGIAGSQKGPCGAISAAAVCLGLRHRCSTDDKEKVEEAHEAARRKAGELAKSFTEEFGTISCIELVGVDFSIPGNLSKFFDSGQGEQKCHRFVRYCIEKLYEFDNGV